MKVPNLIKSIIELCQEVEQIMTDSEREQFWEEIQSGYCKNCGSSSLPCYCMNDD